MIVLTTKYRRISLLCFFCFTLFSTLIDCIFPWGLLPIDRDKILPKTETNLHRVHDVIFSIWFNMEINDM
jgi:hypothetical protein